LDDGPPIFNQDFSCPSLLVPMPSSSCFFRVRGYHPLLLHFPMYSTSKHHNAWQALPLSLAATQRISFDFFSSRYLDVSVPQVRSYCFAISNFDYSKLGFPIRTSLDHSLVPTPQSFSQGPTSFIASYCQGIHRLRILP
jgi:hypothetical protein